MITIVGAGALGSHVALFLRNQEQKLKVIDFDKVEQKNTMAQFHSKMGLRRNKALELSQSMRGLFGVSVQGVTSKLTNDNVNVLLFGSDVVVDCTDNIEARDIIQDFWKATETPTVHGALSADGSFGQIMWASRFKADAEGEEGEATCVDGEHLPFFAAVAAQMALEVQSFLKTGKKKSYQISPSGIIRVA